MAESRQEHPAMHEVAGLAQKIQQFAQATQTEMIMGRPIDDVVACSNVQPGEILEAALGGEYDVVEELMPSLELDNPDFLDWTMFGHANEVVTERYKHAVVLGKGDQLSPEDRAARYLKAIENSQPVFILDPICGASRFIQERGSSGWASVVGVVTEKDLIVAVAVDTDVVVGTEDIVEASMDGNPLQPVGCLDVHPSDLPGRIVLPANHGCSGGALARLTATHQMIVGAAGNPMIVNSVILRADTAVYQQPSQPWDAMAMYLASAANRHVVTVNPIRKLISSDIRTILLNALENGTPVPGMVAAFDELQATKLAFAVGSDNISA
jgi:hypothetical protein